MKKQNLSAKDFANVVKGAKVEVKGVFNNPFVVCNLLEKAAKGDFEKIANVSNISRENLAKVAKVLKGMHGQRYAFSFDFLLSNSDLFRKDNNNILCSVSTSKNLPSWSFQLLDIIPCTDKVPAKFVYLRPVVCSINAIFAAFAKVAKVDIKNSEKAAKDSEKAAKDKEKEYNRAKKGVIKDYNDGKISEIDLATKLSELKEKYANVA